MYTVISHFYRGPSLQVDDDDDEDNGGDGRGGRSHQGGEGGGPCSSSEALKTDQQIAGEAVLTRIVKEVDGVSFSFR